MQAEGKAIKGIINHPVPTVKGQAAAGLDKATAILSPMEQTVHHLIMVHIFGFILSWPKNPIAGV